MLSALAMPGMSALQAGPWLETASSTRIVAISENSCSDTESFASQLPSSILEADPGAVLLQLEQGFQNGDVDIIYGLTRDSNLVLIEQYAQQSRYRLAFHGVHQYTNSGLQHRITADTASLGLLKKQLIRNKEDWTGGISQLPALTTFNIDSHSSETFQTAHRPTGNSPGQLTSWLFRKLDT